MSWSEGRRSPNSASRSLAKSSKSTFSMSSGCSAWRIPSTRSVPKPWKPFAEPYTYTFKIVVTFHKIRNTHSKTSPILFPKEMSRNKGLHLTLQQRDSNSILTILTRHNFSARVHIHIQKEKRDSISPIHFPSNHNNYPTQTSDTKGFTRSLASLILLDSKHNTIVTR
jgi:hypothetical protein